MSVNFEYKGWDGAKWGTSDFYEDFEIALQKSIDSGEDFDTGWWGVKKEIQTFRIARNVDSLLDAVMVQVSVSDDFDTEGFGETTVYPLDLPKETKLIDAIKKALDAALDEAEENRKMNQVYEGFTVGRDGQWEETFILQLDGEYEYPPGDEYHWWGWQAFDPNDRQEDEEHIVPENIRKAMEEWIINDYGKWDRPFTIDGWTITRWKD